MVGAKQSKVWGFRVVVALDKKRFLAAKGFRKPSKLRVFAIAFTSWETAGAVFSVKLNGFL